MLQDAIDQRRRHFVAFDRGKIPGKPTGLYAYRAIESYPLKQSDRVGRLDLKALVAGRNHFQVTIVFIARSDHHAKLMAHAQVPVRIGKGDAPVETAINEIADRYSSLILEARRTIFELLAL